MILTSSIVQIQHVDGYMVLIVGYILYIYIHTCQSERQYRGLQGAKQRLLRESVKATITIVTVVKDTGHSFLRNQTGNVDKTSVEAEQVVE